MTFLLDVNLLIALMDADHVGHRTAHAWFDEEGRHSWASCPITENGLIRILGAARYPNSPGNPGQTAALFSKFTQLPGHCFWPDDLSLLTSPDVNVARVLTPGQVTDTYLLALAVANGGRLATLDRRLAPHAVKGGKAALHIISD